LDEFYCIAFGKKVLRSVDDLQTDLGVWLDHYDREKTIREKVLEANTGGDLH